MGIPKPKLVSLQEQAKWLGLLRGFSCRIVGKVLVARGKIRPLPISDEYTLEIKYELGKRPHVYVLEPEIQRRNGERAEHMYSDNEPCVFLPNSGEWSKDKLLAETLVPWTMLWLAFYETWVITGRWDGGGVHPPGRK
jgi:hypothetical protein